jgi:hypothetical protein
MDAPADFGWIMNGWVKRLLAVEAAEKALFAANLRRRDDLEAVHMAELKLLEAKGELWRYKDELMTGLTLVLRWVLGDVRHVDHFTAILRGAMFDILNDRDATHWVDLAELRKEVAALRERVVELEGSGFPISLNGKGGSNGGVVHERGQGGGQEH